MNSNQLTPRQIVEELDKYIIGQDEAKRAVAIALRNRYRRSRLEPEIREDITPKNILMVGPTGVGKTEIARRLAKLVDAPLVKVEATKFTEVGYVGRDVDSMVRDLVETSLRLVKERMGKDVEIVAEQNAQERILDALVDKEKGEKKADVNPIEALLGPVRKPDEPPEVRENRKKQRERLRMELMCGSLEGEIIEIEVEDTATTDTLPGTDVSLGDVFGGLMPKKKKIRKVSVIEARKILKQEEISKLIDMDKATSEAVYKAEEDGILFIDEIDKVAGQFAVRQPGRLPRGRAARHPAHRGGLHRQHQIRPGQDRPHALYRRRRVPCGQGHRPDSGIAGPLPCTGEPQAPDGGGLPPHPHPAGKRADQAVSGADGGGRCGAELYARRAGRNGAYCRGNE